MQTLSDFDHSPALSGIIRHWLSGGAAGILTNANVKVGYDIFKNAPEYDEDEMYDLPAEAQIHLRMLDVESKESQMVHGTVWLGEYREQRFVAEQNAAPLLIYYI